MSAQLALFVKVTVRHKQLPILTIFQDCCLNVHLTKLIPIP